MASPGGKQRSAAPAGWTKAIRFDRDVAQSRALTFSVAGALALATACLWLPAARPHSLLMSPLVISLGFTLLAWRLRAATRAAATIGGLVCLQITHPGALSGLPLHPASAESSRHSISTLLGALVMLFVLTFLATRFRRAGKEKAGLAEARTGRRASQVIANLGVAALCAAVGFPAGVLAALAEATADTVSSEVGQSLGGRTLLLMSGQSVPPGTDGGISLYGTAAGLAAGGLTILAGCRAVTATQASLALAAAAAGLFFDSALGATVERRGWIGNDLVNFTSTCFAVACVWFLLRV